MDCSPDEKESYIAIYAYFCQFFLNCVNPRDKGQSIFNKINANLWERFSEELPRIYPLVLALLLIFSVMHLPSRGQFALGATAFIVGGRLIRRVRELWSGCHLQKYIFCCFDLIDDNLGVVSSRRVLYLVIFMAAMHSWRPRPCPPAAMMLPVLALLLSPSRETPQVKKLEAKLNIRFGYK